MTTAPSTLLYALKQYDKEVVRLKDIEEAVYNLSDENPHLSAVTCMLMVYQGVTAPIGIDASREFLKPLFAAALTNQRELVSGMLRKLEAARTSMQQESLKG